MVWRRLFFTNTWRSLDLKRITFLDTFNGFTKDDLRVEFSDRDNRHSWIIGLFKDNDPDWFKHSLAQRGIVDVAVIASDISTLDPLLLPERIAFCLLDVDLYQPVKVGLEKIYPRLSPGGIIVVDDCWSKSRHLFVEGVAEAYDGAMQAYREFVSTEGLPEELVETKFGIIRKPG